MENDKIPFKEYYLSLSDSEKANLREKIISTGICRRAFYYKISSNSWSLLERKFIQRTTKKIFQW